MGLHRASPRRRILIVDDERSVLWLLRTTLDDERAFEVSTASDGEEALHIARTLNPHVVFSDILIPKVDGVKVCRQLKADPDTAWAKVVMVTALGSEEMREEALAAGADDYLLKPFSPTRLLDIALSEVETVPAGTSTVSL